MSQIKLLKERTNGGATILKSLELRKTVWEFSPKELTFRHLSDLFWAATGINRQGTTKRTNGFAQAAFDINLYSFTKDGTYIYNIKEHALDPVNSQDLRPIILTAYPLACDCPICLIITSDLTRFPGIPEQHMKQYFAAMNAGIVSQNISLFCSGFGLACVQIGNIEREQISQAMNFPETEMPMICTCVGYPKEDGSSSTSCDFL